MSNEEKEPKTLSEKEQYSLDVNFLRSQLQAERDKLTAAQTEIADWRARWQRFSDQCAVDCL